MPELSYPQTTDTHARGRSIGLIIFLLVIGIGAAYCAVHLVSDLQSVQALSFLPYLLLAVALLIALGFEFVNGFHDTANAVATVIYTHSLTPNLAVIWSGTWNFLGVLTSTGAVAFGVLQLLPVELILQVGSSAGFAMVFALLIAAIIWNLGTWYFGLPSSSSHTLVGSIIGVGLMNQLMHGASGTSGVDWNQALGVGKSLLFSPIVGFLLSGLLLLVLKAVVRVPALYAEPKGAEPPPFWIRGLLVLTCTGVSFAHGSNDGQKGMGLIMLILIGTVPTAYALNKAVTPAETQTFLAVAHEASATFGKYTNGASPSAHPRAAVEDYVRTRQLTPETLPALQQLTNQIAQQVGQSGSLASVPQDVVDNVRNNMYVASEAVRPDGKGQAARLRGGRRQGDRQLQEADRSRHQIHSDMGQGRGRDRPWAGDDGRLETHCRDGRRENRQAASDLWARRLGGTGGDADHRCGRRLWPAGLDHPRAVLGCGRYDGGQWLRAAMEHRAQPAAGVGTDAARFDRAGGRLVFFFPFFVFIRVGRNTSPLRRGLATTGAPTPLIRFLPCRTKSPASL